MSKEMYLQGRLRKETDSGCIEKMTWAPQRQMVAGRTVSVEEDNGEWSHGWKVAEVYGQPVSQEYVTLMRHAHTIQRRASDI